MSEKFFDTVFSPQREANPLEPAPQFWEKTD